MAFIPTKTGGVWFDPYRKHIKLEVSFLYRFVQFPCKEPLITIIKPNFPLIHVILWKSHSDPITAYSGDASFVILKTDGYFFSLEIDALLARLRHT